MHSVCSSVTPHRPRDLQTPRWLIKQGRDADAARSLSRLTSLPQDHPEIQTELDEIRAALKEEEELGESSYMDCFRFTHNKIFFRTMTGIFIQAWQQLTGINFIFYCTSLLFLFSNFPTKLTLSSHRRYLVLPELWY